MTFVDVEDFCITFRKLIEDIAFRSVFTENLLTKNQRSDEGQRERLVLEGNHEVNSTKL